MRLIFRTSFVFLFLVFLGACKKNQAQEFDTPIDVYENKGLKLAYPRKWEFTGDGSSIRANRLTSFGLSSYSVFSIEFYKSKPIKIDKLVNNYANKLAKSKVEEMTPPKIEKVSIAGFPGTAVSWTRYFMGESKEQGVVIQIQEEPFPVFVNAYLFQEDIDEYWKHIEPLLKSITFDPNKIELEEPSLF